MARNKKGAPAPRGGNSARGGRGGRGGRGASRGRGHHSPAPGRVNFIREEIVGFTLADEARHTSQHDPSIWNNLRMRPVKFVSAGPTEPLKLLDVLLDETNDEAGEPATAPSPEHDTQRDLPANIQDEPDNETDNDGEKCGHEADAEEEPGEDGQFIGPDELEEAIQAQAEPDNETSAEPSFFFDLKGDQSQTKPQQGSVEIPERPSSRSSSSSEEVILFKGRGIQKKTQHSEEISMSQMQTEIRVVEQTIATESTPAPAPLAPELAVEPSDRKKLSRKEKKQRQRNQRNAQRRFEEEEEEDAILADYITNMKNNSDDDYFRRLLQAGRDSDGAEEDASDSSDATSEQQRASPKPNVLDTGDSDEDQEEDLSEEDGEDDDDPGEIDDETLAKLIAGQDLSQDLGMEDVNFGHSSSDSESSSDAKIKTRQHAVNDDVDLMDWERPSLRRRTGKGAQAQINFNVSDSELEAQLQAAWKNDRQRKSERKKRREELRALGMLGKNANPDDLRVKYPDGMNMEQVAEELREFLMNSDEQLALPPMDNHARKMIHELANKFKIKSKSTGKADQRRPTLYRTGRTLPYVEVTFDQAINRVNRRYFPRLDMKGKKSNRLPPARGGAGLAAATYQDGEIVGGSAPELGVENRGRAMLEKMGWSSGTALGAVNNKGILQPVTHAMKRSKAGLG